MPAARVRELEYGDLGDIMRLAAEFHAASVYRDYRLEPAKVRTLYEHALVLPSHRAIVAADSETDRPQGYLMGICFEHYFSNTLTVSDVGFYIAPAYRALGIARAMLKRFEAWAWEQGAADISLGVSAGIADAGVVQLYERLGYARGVYTVVKKRL